MIKIQSLLFSCFQGGSEILESLGYTEYTGFALQYPRSVIPQFFADHIGNLTVELVLASVEISTLLIRVPPTLETLAVLMEAEAFPGNEPEGDDYDHEIVTHTIFEMFAL